MREFRSTSLRFRTVMGAANMGCRDARLVKWFTFGGNVS
jgi:hypothetical protein